jgi:hypothetical protein
VSTKIALILAPLLLVGGFFLGRATRTEVAAEDVSRVEQGSAGTLPIAEADPTLQPAEESWQRERERRVAAEEELARLREEVAVLRRADEIATEGPPAATEADPETEAAVPYVFAGTEDALRAMDFEVAGEAIANMTPILGEVAKALAEGRQVPPSVGDVQRWNGPLVKQALIAQQSGVPGTGVNGAFTHPSVLVNMVHSTLAHAGLPLDEHQQARLRDLGDRFVEEDARRLAGYDETTLEFRKIVEETTLKDRLYEAIDGILTQEQRDMLHPPDVRGRLRSDLFSSGIVWLQFARTVRYTDRPAMAEAFIGRVLRDWNFDDEAESRARELSRTWASSFTDAYLTETLDALSRQGIVPMERVRIAAKNQLAFYTALHAQLSPGSEAAERVRSAQLLMVPVSAN